MDSLERLNDLIHIRHGLAQIIDENKELKKENEELKEQLNANQQNKIIEELLKTIEELKTKNDRLEHELQTDPTRNYLINNRNGQIVKLLTEAFKYINEPSLINQNGMFM